MRGVLSFVTCGTHLTRGLCTGQEGLLQACAVGKAFKVDGTRNATVQVGDRALHIFIICMIVRAYVLVR